MEQLISAKQLKKIVADSVQQALDGARIDPTDSSWNWIASERLSFLKLIDNMPIAETNVDPLWHGHWIKNEDRSGWHCSCCGKDDLYAYPYTENNERELQDFYCPNCGAKMDESTISQIKSNSRENCPYRHANGNCLPVGGFCLAVADEYCPKINEINNG